MVVPMSIRQPSVGSYYVLDWTTPLAAERHTLEVAYPARGKRWKSGHAFTAANDDDELQPRQPEQNAAPGQPRELHRRQASLRALSCRRAHRFSPRGRPV